MNRPYWLDFLSHPINQGLVALLGVAGIIGSYPYGMDAIGVTVLLLLAIETVGLAVIPGLPSFRAAMDKEASVEAREKRRQTLLHEINAHGGSNYENAYLQMCQRVQSLYRTAKDSANTMSEREVDQLNDLTVGYLGLCLTESVLSETESTSRMRNVQRQLAAVEDRLARSGLSHSDEQQLKRAKAEYDEVLTREASMLSRRSMLEASLAAIPVRVEEIYQMVMMAPVAGKLSELLEESATKLRLAQDSNIDVEAYFGLKTAEAEIAALVDSTKSGNTMQAGIDENGVAGAKTQAENKNGNNVAARAARLRTQKTERQ